MFTPEYAEIETGVPAEQVIQAAEAIAAAGTAFSTHSWRAAAAGHLWGWQITRCLYLLVVLMGAIGEPGGVNLHVTNKFVPKHPNPPPPPDYWNELLFPKEFPLAFFEMSFLLPHFLKEGPRPARHVLHARLQPALDQSRRLHVDGSAEGRVEDRPPRRADADLERDRVVRRLHPADGARHRAARL